MESLEFNKIAAAILVAVLITVGISKLGGILYHADSPDEMSYIVEIDDASGTTAAEDTAPAMSFDQMLAMAEPEGGETIFRKCVSCHTWEEGGAAKQGPNLWNIVGREVASVPGFSYSSALTDLGGTWTYERLDEFLAAPRTYAPGTKMTFAGLKDMAQRADLVAWMRTHSNDPVPLPDVVMETGSVEEQVEGTGSMDPDETEAQSVVDTVDDTMESAGDTADDAMDAAGDMVDDAVDAAGDMADDAADAASDVADEASDAASDVTDGASDAIDSVTGDDAATDNN